MVAVLIAGLLLIAAGLLGVLLLHSNRDLRELRNRFSPLLDLEREVQLATDALTALAERRQRLERDYAATAASLDEDLATRRAQLDRMAAEVAAVEENLADISVGLYRPHYSFSTSDEFKRELEGIRERMKAMVRNDTAAPCSVAWTVGGSTRDGQKMQKQLSKLMLRAFNGETDAAIAKVTWDNAHKMEERIRKAYEAINKLGTVVQVAIAWEYFELSMAELRLEHELALKRQAELEEQRRIKEQMREEERAQREARRAQDEAAAEEERYAKALDKARADMAKAKGEKLDQLSSRIAELERQLFEAHERKERAISMAQLTRAGHVYVISNIGSFGDEVFKIGMTRRLEPMDRVRELGDASVPFEFDVHAIIPSLDAPGLEADFHRYFEARRLNAVNLRKEFFRVSIREIEQFVRSKGLDIQLTLLAEAREYRETLSLRAGSTPEPVEPVMAPAARELVA
jgi:CII-binding regulator of phage lambda lysogenization HflD